MRDGSDTTQRPDLRRRLGRAGYIVTYPRQVVFAVLERQPGAFTAEEIVRAVGEREPKIGRATVFRTLALLEHLGAVERVPVTEGGVPSGSHYLLCAETAHHHHLMCLACGRVETVVGCGLEEWIRMTAERTGFSAEDHVAFVLGRCRRCQTRPPLRPSDGGITSDDALTTE